MYSQKYVIATRRINEMDKFVARKRPNDARVYQYIPYLTLKDSYQRLLMELGPKVLQCPT